MTGPDLSATALAEAGAAPVDVDVTALLAQIQALQSRVDTLATAQGIPADPIAAAVKDLRDHAKARADSLPGGDFGELTETLTNLSDAPSKDDAELVRTVLDELNSFEGLDYLKKLATKLHKLVLKG